MTRDCGHGTGDDRTADTVQGMTRDCGLVRTETADTVQGTRWTRDCRHSRDDQRMQTVQGNGQETADLWGGEGERCGH
ncbi:unnamed protein product, partial [Staurois parvus]